MSDPNVAQWTPENIAATLSQLPGLIADSDVRIGELEAQLGETTEASELAEVNASLDAVCDGKDAATRDLQRKRAILSNEVVQASKKNSALSKVVLEQERADNKKMARQFAAWCHIAEMKAARMTLMAKGDATAKTNGATR